MGNKVLTCVFTRKGGLAEGLPPLQGSGVRGGCRFLEPPSEFFEVGGVFWGDVGVFEGVEHHPWK